ALDGANLGSAVTAAPYAVNWDTTGVSNGSHTLTAIATDGVGLKTTSAPVTITVNNTSTTTSGLTFAATSGIITAPFTVTSSGTIVQPSYTSLTAGGQAVYTFTISAAGDYVVSALVNAPNTSANSFFVNIDAQPTDPAMVWDVPVTSGLVSETVDWRGSGTADSTSPSGFDDQYTPKVFSLTAGTHQLIVRGREGNCQLGTLTIAPVGGSSTPTPPADTTPPTVAIIAPANGTTVSGTAVVLSATASDDGTVASVQFQWDGASVGSPLTVAPYSLTVDTMTAANGTHTITAIATDGAGLKATSAPITVTVSNAAPPPPSTLTFAATSGLITAPFSITSGGAIAQPSYTSVTAGGQAIYTFTIDTAGDYVVSALVNAPNTSANSFFVNIDAQPTDPTMIWDVPLTSGLQGETVAWRGNGTTSSSSSSGFNDQYTPKVFTLSVGTHQLIVRGREGNCQLSTLTIAPTNL
ncbi:MAG: hypothetical protein KGS61_15670, partial [Verrucomicrobia bacterium]|nr:hypothetical protein [Verrucomicrobiota bacterium]